MSRSPRHVAVVGGGVIGVASAYYLARAGCAVTLVERDAVGMGCSHANCGLVCPSHVLPLAEPGALGQVLRTL
jgi:D-amino-acid dehydrogenase